MVTNVIVWTVRLTAKLCTTDEAAAYTGLPAWLAWMVQVPKAISEAVEPEIVQMAELDDVKLTASPELAVAVNARVEFAD
jgi:hypothetical protein